MYILSPISVTINLYLCSLKDNKEIMTNCALETKIKFVQKKINWQSNPIGVHDSKSEVLIARRLGNNLICKPISYTKQAELFSLMGPSTIL